MGTPKTVTTSMTLVKKRKAPTSRKVPVRAEDPSRALVKAIAMDVGKEMVAYIRVMYPEAIAATSSTFPLSVRNHIYNDIMAAIEVTDEGRIISRLNERRKFRREWLAQWKKIREMKDAK